ncbi:transposase [Paenibacillus sp. ISL-20]|uniref:transposase n=1 Tax=Paenibacillus sp. ISL-20 TaxID=2819163 RepID=UPI001BEB357E|nr:transposase [Paenibacillus sp. ISL-20]MBT2761882.1 transposase [Paenibacillus sp. ISL-20]
MAGRTSHDREFKQEMAKRLAAGESVSALSKETGVSESTIRGWKNIEIEQNAFYEDKGLKLKDEELRYRILKEENNARILAIVEQLLKQVSR